jgi:uncharacterized membrane protein YgdD (TMEM256/DUF423 family)
MNQKNTLTIIGVLGAIAVILGAFGAHSLKSVLSESQLSTFETGVRYHYYHTFAIFGVYLLQQKLTPKRINLINTLFLIGILLFSGSIYLLACKDILGIENWKFLGPITPIGGTFFIVGWILLATASLTSRLLSSLDD